MTDARRSRSGRRLPLLLLTMGIAAGVVFHELGPVLRAQGPAVNFGVRAASGLVVSPVYEGWYQLGDKTYVLFGYYNRNLEEVVDIPIGPQNKLEPGPADQAQPTRFFPGRHYGVFAVAVPGDRSGKEVTWTLSANGQALSIPAFLDALYFVFPQREDGGPSPGNTPPVVRFEASGPPAQGPLGVTVTRTATVSRPLALDVWVIDDGLPRAEAAREGNRIVAPGSARSARPQGLTVGWRVYRGPGGASFSNPTPAPLEHGKAQTMVTFDQAGDYVLHLLAIDSRSGTMCCWTNGYVKVAVEAQKPDRKSNGAAQ